MEEMLFPLCNALTDNCAISLFFQIDYWTLENDVKINSKLLSLVFWLFLLWLCTDKKIHNHDAGYVFYFCRAHCVHTRMNHQRLVVQSFYCMQCPVQSEIVICSAFTRSLNRYFCEYNYHQNKQKYNLVTKNNEQDKIPGNMYR